MKSFSVVAPFPNPHFLEIFKSPVFREQATVKFYCFQPLPKYRLSLGWEGESYTSLDPSYRRLGKTKRIISESSAIVFLGAIDPRFIPVFLIRHSLKTGQKTFLASEGFRKPISNFKASCLKRMLNHSDLTVLAIGDNCANNYRNAGLAAPTYRKYGFFERYPKIEVETQVQDAPNCVNILSVGQLITRKNFSIVIDALKACSKSLNSNVVYTICGEGSQRGELEDQIAPLPSNISIRLPGNCDPQELSRQFQMADVFVMPSIYDGWGVVLNQAIHAGLPIIVSSQVRSGRDHLVYDHENGHIYHNHEQLCENLIQLVNDPELRKKYGSKSLQLAKLWDIDAVAESLLRLLSGDNPAIPDSRSPLVEI